MVCVGDILRANHFIKSCIMALMITFAIQFHFDIDNEHCNTCTTAETLQLFYILREQINKNTITIPLQMEHISKTKNPNLSQKNSNDR